MATGISDNIRPDIMPFVSVEGTRIDDRDVVEIRVHEGMNKPYFLKSKGPREGGVSSAADLRASPLPGRTSTG